MFFFLFFEHPVYA